MARPGDTEVVLPYLVRPKRLSTRIAGILAVALLPLVAAPAAHAACAATATTKAFSAFADTANYSLVANGGFESGTTGWTLSGASVVAGNETWKVRAATDSKALSVNATGTVVSPSFCVGIEHPTFRFFARRTSGTWGTMVVKLRWKTSGGATNETTVASINGGDTAWHVTDRFALATVLPLWSAGQTASVQIVLDPENYGGNWTVDDIFVDPYTRG